MLFNFLYNCYTIMYRIVQKLVYAHRTACQCTKVHNANVQKCIIRDCVLFLAVVSAIINQPSEVQRPAPAAPASTPFACIFIMGGAGVTGVATPRPARGADRAGPGLAGWDGARQ